VSYKVDCYNCGGEGVIDGDCTCWEDCCCCAEPDPPDCQVCRGRGYLIVSELTDDHCGDIQRVTGVVGSPADEREGK
jgi:hypothetical protein